MSTIRNTLTITYEAQLEDLCEPEIRRMLEELANNDTIDLYFEGEIVKLIQDYLSYVRKFLTTKNSNTLYSALYFVKENYVHELKKYVEQSRVKKDKAMRSKPMVVTRKITKKVIGTGFLTKLVAVFDWFIFGPFRAIYDEVEQSITRITEFGQINPKNRAKTLWQIETFFDLSNDLAGIQKIFTQPFSAKALLGALTEVKMKLEKVVPERLELSAKKVDKSIQRLLNRQKTVKEIMKKKTDIDPTTKKELEDIFKKFEDTIIIKNDHENHDTSIFEVQKSLHKRVFDFIKSVPQEILPTMSNITATALAIEDPADRCVFLLYFNDMLRGALLKYVPAHQLALSDKDVEAMSMNYDQPFWKELENILDSSRKIEWYREFLFDKVGDAVGDVLICKQANYIMYGIMLLFVWVVLFVYVYSTTEYGVVPKSRRKSYLLGDVFDKETADIEAKTRTKHKSKTYFSYASSTAFLRRSSSSKRTKRSVVSRKPLRRRSKTCRNKVSRKMSQKKRRYN